VSGEGLVRVGLFLLRQLARLPYGALRRVGNVCGDLAYVLAAPRRRVTLVNLRLCFPDMREDARRTLARAHFRCFMRSFIDRFVVWLSRSGACARWWRCTASSTTTPGGGGR